MTCSSSYQSRKLIAGNVSKAEVHIRRPSFALDTAAEGSPPWTLDLFSGETLSKRSLCAMLKRWRRRGRIRAREKETTSITEASALDSSARNQR